jgi:hypothetical protein
MKSEWSKVKRKIPVGLNYNNHAMVNANGFLRKRLFLSDILLSAGLTVIQQIIFSPAGCFHTSLLLLCIIFHKLNHPLQLLSKHALYVVSDTCDLNLFMLNISQSETIFAKSL